ncbi:gluconokinase, GntK/IdnK-type [Sulfurimonas sp. HSL-1716]|uniref:gluconokinase n=1 Tax=Hydrocurvibacter sulfurireducens TaxID=3131937 RepID=UPI0031F7BFA1
MIYIVCGVSGAGKTSVGIRLAELLTCPFYDADDYHSDINIEKMANNIPLTDDDRSQWLEKLSQEIKGWNEHNKMSVLACSALKEKYRKILSKGSFDIVQYIFLDIDYDTAYRRLKARQNHFFSEELLKSQYDILEINNNVLTVSMGNDNSVDEICSKIMTQIGKDML